MANRREFRRAVYCGDVQRPDKGYPNVDQSLDERDQVFFVRDVVVVSGQLGSEARAYLRELKAQSLDPVGAIQDVTRYRIAGPVDGSTLPAIVARLAELSPEAEISPEYVFVIQQHVHPGQDPEVAVACSRPTSVESDLGAGTRIVVVDTGNPESARAAKPTTPGAFVRGRIQEPDRVIGNKLFLGPAAGHGWFISDLIGQVAPRAEVHNVSVSGPMGYCSESEIVDGLVRALALKPDIVNLSLGMYGLRVTPGAAPRPPVLLSRAIRRVQDAGVVVVASAGNDDSDDRMFPAALDGVVGVGALGSDGRRWPHSNYGPWITAWTLGDGLVGSYVVGQEDPRYEPDGSADTWASGDLASWSGTSFAAPLVAAQIAVTLGAARALGLPVTPAQAKDIVLATSWPAPGGLPGRHVLVTV